jgi:hypothetical protein
MNATRTIHLLILAAEGVTPHKKQPGTEQKINCLPYYKGSGTQPCIYLLNKPVLRAGFTDVLVTGMLIR